MADETNIGFLCYKKGGSALAYSKIASNNGALIYKGNKRWYIEIELIPNNTNINGSGTGGMYISNTTTYDASGYWWKCYDDKSELNISRNSVDLWTQVNQLKWRTVESIDATAGVKIDSFLVSVTTNLANKFMVESFSKLANDGYVVGYNYITSWAYNFYVTSYYLDGQEIQRTLMEYSPIYNMITVDGDRSVTIDCLKVTIIKDGDDAGKFKLAYANP